MPDFLEGIEESLHKALDTLPVPTPGPPPDGISIHEAIQVSRMNSTCPILSYPISCKMIPDILYQILPDIVYIIYPISGTILLRCLIYYFGQQGLMPALDSDMAEVLTGSEFIVKAYAERQIGDQRSDQERSQKSAIQS